MERQLRLLGDYSVAVLVCYEGIVETNRRLELVLCILMLVYFNLSNLRAFRDLEILKGIEGQTYTLTQPPRLRSRLHYKANLRMRCQYIAHGEQ
jgi:hypothetical protein